MTAIRETFERVAAEGLDRAEVDATLHQIELSRKHQTSGFGMSLGLGVGALPPCHRVHSHSLPLLIALARVFSLSLSLSISISCALCLLLKTLSPSLSLSCSFAAPLARSLCFLAATRVQFMLSKTRSSVLSRCLALSVPLTDHTDRSPIRPTRSDGRCLGTGSTAATRWRTSSWARS